MNDIEYRNYIRRRWHGIKKRCITAKPGTKAYRNYQGRGITVCDEWLVFDNFYKWAVDNKIAPGLIIERTNNNKGYSPENCILEPKGRESSNTRKSVWIEYKGEKKILNDWVNDPRCQVSYSLLRSRLKKGMEFYEALTTPPDENGGKYTHSSFITAFGELKSINQWSKDKRCSVPAVTICARIKMGWSEHDAVAKPKRKADLILTAWNETKSIYAWSKDERCSITQTSIMKRLKNGWSPEDAVGKPSQQLR